MLGSEMAIVTPGIRPLGAELGDQSRIATPRDAILAGASHLVIGRPIFAAENRNRATKLILSEIDDALRSAQMEMAGTRPA